MKDKRMSTEIELKSLDGSKKKIIIREGCFSNKVLKFNNLRLFEATRKILENRGVKTAEEMKSFLKPSLSQLYNPFLLRDMDIAVNRVIRAIKRNEGIFIVGDYDTDGVTATSLLLRFFREIDVKAYFYIPKREDGYGLSVEAIKKALNRGSSLIITVDNGITSIDEVEFAKNVGIDVIITDHHEPQEELPNAYAVVNPKRSDSKFPFKELSGVGVAFNLVMALRGQLRKRGFFSEKEEPNLKKYLDLVALGTLADIVPLLDENRVCVKIGLFNNTHSTVGLESLKKVSGIDGMLTSKHVGFVLAPRINAAGRLNDASIVVDMFMKDTVEEAEIIAKKLNEINVQRRKLQLEIIKEVEGIVKNTNDPIIVVAKEGWHKGVIGIVANAIAYKHKKPTIIITKGDNVSVGSGRSVGDIDLFSVVKKASHLLEKFGGHRMAIGITIKNRYLDDFKQSLNDIVKEKYKDYQPVFKYEVDCDVSFSIFTRRFLEELVLLEPHGPLNEEPLFICRNVIVKDKTYILSKYPKYLLGDGTSNLWMVSFDKLDLNIGYVYDILFTATIKNGYPTFTLKDAFFINQGG